jgi:hypothetical protein
MGVLGYLQGDGRYGVLEILKHLTPGLFVDLSWPVFRRLPHRAIVFCALGTLAAVARTSTEFAIMFLVGARAELYAFAGLTLATNLVAGALSGFVTFYLLPLLPATDNTDRSIGDQSPTVPAAAPEPTIRAEVVTEAGAATHSSHAPDEPVGTTGGPRPGGGGNGPGGGCGRGDGSGAGRRRENNDITQVTGSELSE